MLDLKQQGRIRRIGMCGTNGKKLPAVREHLQTVLGDVYEGIDPSVLLLIAHDAANSAAVGKSDIASTG